MRTVSSDWVVFNIHHVDNYEFQKGFRRFGFVFDMAEGMISKRSWELVSHRVGVSECQIGILGDDHAAAPQTSPNPFCRRAAVVTVIYTTSSVHHLQMSYVP